MSQNVYCVISGKGGTGRSFITANVGAAVASLGKKVLLLDLDLTKPNLHTCFKTFTITDETIPLLNLRSEEDHLPVQQTDIADLFIVPGNRYLEPEDMDRMSKINLSSLFAKEEFDYIFIDLPSGWSKTLLAWLVNPFQLLFVVEPNPFSIEGFYDLLKRILAVRMQHILNKENARFVSDVILSPSRQVQKDVYDILDHFRENDSSVVQKLKGLLKVFHPALVVNKARSLEEKQVGESIAFLCKRQYGLDVDILGAIDFDDNIWQTLRDRQLVITEKPMSVATRLVNNIAVNIVEREKSRREMDHE